MSLSETHRERESGAAALPAYAELHCLSNFTFLRGASHPHELVEQAAALGYRALAITDECSVAGVVRAHMAAKDRQLQAHHRRGIPSRLRSEVRRARDRPARLRTAVPPHHPRPARGRQGRNTHSRARTSRRQLPSTAHILWLPAAQPQPEELRWLAALFPGAVRIAVELLREGADSARLATLTQLGAQCGVPLIASGDVHMHVRARRRLQDALTAIRLNVPIAQAGSRLYANGERYLRERARLARLYPHGAARGHRGAGAGVSLLAR